ncbi:MAG: hypothetical protein ATN35_03610 [Epulopiscium sp. Nele67-Bin004]|nr:MAG: hypothetical protein ATN35_03610 [Epulopiscium sp. Nele67-Bin004]
MNNLINFKDLEDFKYQITTFDTTFFYKDREFIVCPLDKIYVCEALDDMSKQIEEIFIDANDLLMNWKIDGISIEKLVDKFKY